MVETIPLHLIDTDTPHQPDFIFRIPNPKHGRYLVMLFRTEAEVETRKGREHVSPGDFIVFSPEFPLWHTSVKGSSQGFRNDWFYVSPDAIVPEIKRRNFPLNSILPTGKKSLLEPFVTNLKESILRHDDLTEEAIILTLGAMFVAVVRAHRDYLFLNRKLPIQGKIHITNLLNQRDILRKDPGRPFNIHELASKCGLSPERFVFLYRNFFGKTPFAELMEARNLLAQRLLFQTGKTIVEIAEECGWKDHRYFDRVFRKMNGITPTEFRKNG